MSFQHNCNHNNCDHQPTNDDGSDCNLNHKIYLENLQCLNETSDGSAKKIFRSWEDRLNTEIVK